VGENCKGIFPGIVHRNFGYVSESRLRNIMSSADLFLYPTRHEGFGLMPLESFACRCPVVTTEAVPYVKHGINAMVSPVNDVATLANLVKKLLSEDGTAQALRLSGAVFAESHSLVQTLEAFHGFITILEASSGR